MGETFSASQFRHAPPQKEGFKSGYLRKQGHIMRNWKKRLFELDYKAAVLRYKDEYGTVKGEIKLCGSWVQHIDKAITSLDHCFELVAEDVKLLIQAQTAEEAEEWAHELGEVANRFKPSIRDSALRCLSTLDVSEGPLGQYLGYKCCAFKEIEGIGYYDAQDHPTDPPSKLYVFEVHTNKSSWLLYRRFSKFDDTYLKLCSYKDQTTIRVPPLPSKSLLALSDKDILQRFKCLFEWLQTVLDHLQANCSRYAPNYLNKYKNAKIFKQTKIFMTFLCEGANCPTKPESGILDDWATPIDTKNEELNELAQKMDLNYDPADVDSVPWMKRVATSEEATRDSDLSHLPQGALVDLETSVRGDIAVNLRQQNEEAKLKADAITMDQVGHAADTTALLPPLTTATQGSAFPAVHWDTRA
jgi:hypothetical protein